LLRSQEWLNYAVIAIRAKLGAGLAVEHEDIISAVRDHDSAAARSAMEQHITKLMAEVERYWHEVFRSNGAA
jgi:DNA-binding GntR family transcriptional regulator